MRKINSFCGLSHGVRGANEFNNSKNLGNARGFTLIEVMVALSLLSLGIAGVAQLHHLAYQHIALTQEMQEASYFADSHLNTLSTGGELNEPYQTGEYSRGLGLEAYPWELNLVELNSNVLQPESVLLSDKVRPVRADLTVWIDQGARALRFHSLLLLEPRQNRNSPRPEFKLGVKK